MVATEAVARTEEAGTVQAGLTAGAEMEVEVPMGAAGMGAADPMAVEVTVREDQTVVAARRLPDVAARA